MKQQLLQILRSIGKTWFPMVFPWFSYGFPMVFLWETACGRDSCLLSWSKRAKLGAQREASCVRRGNRYGLGFPDVEILQNALPLDIFGVALGGNSQSRNAASNKDPKFDQVVSHTEMSYEQATQEAPASFRE